MKFFEGGKAKGACCLFFFLMAMAVMGFRDRMGYEAFEAYSWPHPHLVDSAAGIGSHPTVIHRQQEGE